MSPSFLRPRPSRRFLLLRWRRKVAKGEAYVAGYEFPPHVGRRVRRKHPQLDDAGWALVEQGLREWFVCCAWRGRAVLGMPSRLVDDAWHEFILDSVAYTQFCNGAFGAYLHHTPEEAMAAPMPTALANTVLAWDSSLASEEGESVLWNLDERLEVAEPLGVSEAQRNAARTATPLAPGVAACVVSGGDAGGHGAGGADGGGGAGGCGGGGCGGGGGGGS